MFTSRAEYRLVLRADNADQRLTPKGEALGCIGTARRAAFAAKSAALAEARAALRALRLTPNEARRHGLTVNQDGVPRNAATLLSYPDISFADLARVWPQLGPLRADIVEQLEIDARYSGYLERQEADILAFRRDEGLLLPAELDYAAVAGLSAEVRQKLTAVRPTTLGQAARISGVTPAALTVLLSHVRRQDRRASA
jgi:tRNA uridine 5-carboxymethylaminomethyl modification enzyme